MAEIEKNNPLLGAQAQPTVLSKATKIDIDTDKVLVDNIIEAGLNGGLDTSALENFTSMSNSRDQIYQLIDTMAADSSVSSIVRTYAEEVCEPADNGHIVWCESADPNVSKFVNYLLNVINVDKNIFGWTYSLIKYGDVYLKLYRESDYADTLFKKDKIDTAETAKSSLHESFEQDLNENVNLNIHSTSDPYSYYVEMVNDPGSMFELTKYGKTYGYIEVPMDNTGLNLMQNYLATQATPVSNYKMRSNEVNIYQADDFVHACLDDAITRFPEKVEIFLTDDDMKNNTNATSYTVRRGKSLLYDSYKIWREKSLLENAALLNRITRSSVVRNVQVEVGDMPKTQVQNTLHRVKELFEQKSAINTNNGGSYNEYNNPGPIENNIFTATHNGQGAITINSVGGDVEVKNLADLDWWNNKFYSSYGIPKQYFGWCLGKDTKILLLDGTTHTIEDLYNNKAEYIGKGIMGCNTNGSLCPTTISNIMLTNEHAQLIRIWLDNNEYVDVTPDHKMMLRDGTFIEAQYLKENDSLMPFYTGIYTDEQRKGRRWVVDNNTGKRRLQFHVVAEKKYGKLEAGYQIHHGPDEHPDKLNDDFDNLTKLTVPEHNEKHINMLHAIAAKRNAERKLDDQPVNANVGSRYITSNRPDTYLKYSSLEPKLSTLIAYVPEVNHKVVKIEYLSNDNKVYDITVADNCHTFALACGIFVHNCDDSTGFNGGTSLSILSSVFAKGVKRVKNSMLQALTDIINLILINKGCRSYLNNFVLKMRTPVTQEEIDFRADLTNRISAISNMQSLFGDVEDKARRLKILKDLIKTLDCGDDILIELDGEIEAAKAAAKKAEEEAEAAAAAEAAANMPAPEKAEPEAPAEAEEELEEIDLGNSAAAPMESFAVDTSKTVLVEGPSPIVEGDEDLPTADELGKDFTENN